MTTPTIDSALTGNTSGTIKIPDYTDALTRIASALEGILLEQKKATTTVALVPVGGITMIGIIPTLAIVGSVTGNIYPGMQVVGTGVKPGTFIVSGSDLVWIVNQAQTVSATPMAIISPLISVASNIAYIKDQAAVDGIHVTSPYAWLGVSSILKLYQEQGVDLTALKAQVDAVPKGL
jgi:hypothetical protein